MAQSSLAARIEARPPRRVLVVQTAFLGDAVFTSALVGALARRFPQAELDLCVSLRGRDVAEAIPGVDQVIVFDKRGADRGPRGLLRAAARVRERSFDLAVLPHRSLRSALLACLGRVPERLGFAGAPGSFLYTARAPDQGRSFLAREAQLARALGAEPGAMRLVPRAQYAAAAEAALERAGARGLPLAALCIGSEWQTKIWPATRFATLAERLAARGLLPVLLGGPGDGKAAAEVQAASDARCLDTTGNSVGEALAFLSRARICVGGDTGLVHAARALGVPTVALFGPTASSVHELAAQDRAVSLELDCSPCSAHGQRRCPLGHHRCLRDLDAERVALACEQVLR